MINKKTHYAIRALVWLAGEWGNGPVSITTIAEKENMPQRFLENILLELKRSGIVDSTRGKSGGFFLVRSPDKVSMLEIITIFEGAVGFTGCANSCNTRECEFAKNSEQCKVHHALYKLQSIVNIGLANTTLDKLI